MSGAFAPIAALGGMSLVGAAGAAGGLLSGIQALTASRDAPSLPAPPPPPTLDPVAQTEVRAAEEATENLAAEQAERSRQVRRRQSQAVRAGGLLTQQVGGRSPTLFGA